jgi:putative tricarboxylic transport membrane protein
MKTLALFVAAAAGLCFSFGAHAATSQWKPEQPIELILGTAPGSGPDRSARVMQRIFQEGKYFGVSVVVVNKPGAGGAVSGAYVHKAEGNGHYLLMAGKGLLTSDVMGRLTFPYAELTPLTVLMDEYIGVAVKADSAIRSGREFLDRMQKDPAAYSIGIATSLGNANHQAVAAALKASGIDSRRARNVIFNSGGAAITALLGGHVDVVPVSLGVLVGELQAGRVRIIAVAAPKRMPGLFAQAPTWREQGADAVVSVWRGAFGAKGLSPAQVTYWEGIFQRLIASAEWQGYVESAYAVSEFMTSAKTREFAERDYAAERAFLSELGLAKPRQ